jgi:putative acetyltransferase
LRGPRIVALDDARFAEIEALWVEGWARIWPAVDFEARRPWLRERRRAGGALWRMALVKADAVAGFYTLDPDSGYIDQFAVAPRCWGTGVAAAMMADAKRLRPAGLSLTVNQANPRAIRFYERMDFRRGEAGVSAAGFPTWAYRWEPLPPP